MLLFMIWALVDVLVFGFPREWSNMKMLTIHRMWLISESVSGCRKMLDLVKVIPRATFSLGSFIRQGMAEISLDMPGLKYSIKCILANPWNSECFFRGRKVIPLSELSLHIFMNHMAYWLNTWDKILIHLSVLSK